MSLIDVSWYKGSASDSYQAYTKKLQDKEILVW